MTERSISPLEFESLAAGFSITEKETWTNPTAGDYSHIYAVREYPDAFMEGLELKRRVIFIFSADSFIDHENDVKAYDECVQKLNAKYGKVAIPSGEIDNRIQAYGIIGHRTVAFSSISIIEKDGTIAVIFPAEEARMEDERIRKELGI